MNSISQEQLRSVLEARIAEIKESIVYMALQGGSIEQVHNFALANVNLKGAVGELELLLTHPMLQQESTDHER